MQWPWNLPGWDRQERDLRVPGKGQAGLGGQQWKASLTRGIPLQEHFSGSACQECRDPSRFGPDCRSGEPQ